MQMKRTTPLKALRDIQTLGSFSPLTFHISLGAKPVANLTALPQPHRATFEHEFGHLLHYATSYFGLTDLLHWAKTIEAITSPRPGLSAEDAVTAAAADVVTLARLQQRYSIDDEYYFEPRTEMFEAARAAKGVWSIKETTGSLFGTTGKLSNHRFWATRFYLGSGALTDRDSFLRIPVGIRTALEHMAKAIDFLGEMQVGDPAALALAYGQQAAEPELLHYYSLTHWVGPRVARAYGAGSIPKAYFICGQLVAVLTEIPFDVPEVWAQLHAYASKHRPDLVPHMLNPHPSFIFPILLHAAFSGAVNYDNFDRTGIETRAAELLKVIGLPSLSDLRTLRAPLRTAISSCLGGSNVGKDLWSLLEWLESYSQSIDWAQRLTTPSIKLGSEPPVPVLFEDDSVLQGAEFSFSRVLELANLAMRRDEMLRFHHARDIIA